MADLGQSGVPPEYDPDVLIGQLEAVRRLPAEDQRTAGEVLSEYGSELVKSADRLDDLHRAMERVRRVREVG